MGWRIWFFTQQWIIQCYSMTVLFNYSVTVFYIPFPAKTSRHQWPCGGSWRRKTLLPQTTWHHKAQYASEVAAQHPKICVVAKLPLLLITGGSPKVVHAASPAPAVNSLRGEGRDTIPTIVLLNLFFYILPLAADCRSAEEPCTALCRAWNRSLESLNKTNRKCFKI